MEQTFIDQLIQAAGQGQWTIFAGLALMVLIHFSRQVMGDALPVKYVPLFAQVLAILGTISAGLIAGAPWWNSIISGVLVGSAASGLWSLVGKILFREKISKPSQDGPLAA